VKKAPLPAGSEQRAAALAVSRYGADKSRVELAVKGILQAKARGQSLDLIAALVTQNILTPVQADGLLEELAAEIAEKETQETGELDTRPGENPSRSNGSRELPPTSSGHYLRMVGEYRLLRRLGQGGMGSVYLGYQEGEKRQVAIKVLSDQLASNKAYVERFYREAKSGTMLDHPNIVRCITAGQDRATGKHFLVLEYVDGPSARTLLEHHGKLSVGDAVHVALDIARGLEHAHSRSIIHRDIKPDNVLTTLSGVAKLADLGLAKRLDEVSHLTGLRVGFGTLDYIPYEQAINAKHADGRSDIYALGGTLYHLLTGEVPFPANSYVEIAEKKLLGNYIPASAHNPEVPPALDRILAKTLAHEAKDRYQVVSQLIIDLERSGLAAAVPSFANPGLAMQDPLVMERLATPAQPTQLDFTAPPNQRVALNGSPDVWFLRYRNREGHWCKAKMTTRQVVERLSEGRLPGEVEAARHSRGAFQPLHTYPEFKDVPLPSADRPPGQKSAQETDQLPTSEEEVIAVSRKRARPLSFWVVLGFGLFLAASAVLYRLFWAP
jgi:serine/threonine-protein kinase